MRLLRTCLRIALFMFASVSVSAPRAHAQDDERSGEPARYVGLASTGVPLRLNPHDDLGQQRFAPAFASALFGYVLASDARYHHGFGLGASMNLGRDGGYAEPVYAGEQLVLMPAYLGYYQLARDLPLLGHVGLPVLVGLAGRSFGLEMGAALAYRLLAGADVFAALDLSTFVGAHATLDALASISVGVAFEYEVLP